MEDAELRRMSAKELRELRANIDTAIRAAIAKSRTVATAGKTGVNSGAPEPVKSFDLEKERDAWQAARQNREPR